MPVEEPEATPLKRARLASGMSQMETRTKLREVRRRRGKMPPKDVSLKRMYTEWEQGRVLPTDWRDELCEVFALPPAALGFVDTAPPPSALDIPSALEITRIDAEIVEMLEQQTDHYRLMDRKVGAAIIPQTVAHVEHMEKLLRTALPGKHSHLAAVALAEGAALAGWQALDAGDVTKAWNLHDVAKAAARQGEDPAVFAHVTAQQAYALLDAGRATEAVELVQYAHTPEIARRVPARLRAWLAAAEAEFLAAAGQHRQALTMLDQAADALPEGDTDPELPFLMLNSTHLARWRGHCLARLGADEAVDDLTRALEGSQVLSSKRAESGLRVDLALALRKRGDIEGSKTHAQRAAELAGSTGSARQRARIAKLLVD
ncbi:hypothetical protein A8924_0872 [Saccharopolyspora erythraea NRRL 2338]|nr:hypothetical protein [Saccharopolyspora erythraea]PFG93622.1 hypothetical protein A8924_0872 [Saccharopolyspora erythraea NRRL 2338]QRK90241.1 hypothetical protein JQX30_01360 [Saccharopolyspora erythraea]QRK90467.1 hypothetical protein JQX30_02865 [Saccharopolyspora erythraea]QRK90477.1 hypothetical protein JQX30_02935 [Saccharopolyspora erythraea]